ncbi:unnamed protein product [Lupinus luteus]|uniref:Uncharacterized protein n=1 Tax=Lupinus luteus TaxID=3873 RepID=A0AAV1VZ20_LUPLU
MAKQFRVPLQIWRHFMKGPASYDAFAEIGKASEARTSHEARVMAWVTFTKDSEHVPSLSPSPRKVCNGMGQFHLVALGRMCHGLAFTYHFGRCNFQLYKLPLTVTWTSQYLYFYLTSHSTVNNYTVPFRGRRPYGYDPCLVKVMRSMTWVRVPWDWPPTRRIWDYVSIVDFAPIRAIAHVRVDNPRGVYDLARKKVGWEGRIEATRAESQWIVAARPLCHLQYPVAYLSRLQRILPAAQWGIALQGVPRGSSTPRGSPTARASGGPRPPTAGRQTGDGHTHRF